MKALRDYECNNCKSVFEYYGRYEDRTPECPKCFSQNTQRIVSLPKLDVFREGYYEIDLDERDPYITSKQQLADECQKRGLVSRYLEEGYDAKRPARWI